MKSNVAQIRRVPPRCPYAKRGACADVVTPIVPKLDPDRLTREQVQWLARIACRAGVSWGSRPGTRLLYAVASFLKLFFFGSGSNQKGNAALQGGK